MAPVQCGPHLCTPCQICNTTGYFCADVCTGGCTCPSDFPTCDPNGVCQPLTGGSCFVAGTRVAMADGTSRPIELVATGDRVLGRAGRVSRVAAIERPVLGSRTLYALNGGPFFVSAEHPFLTDEGWKAIDPAATAAENPGLRVGRLDIGDRLLALAGVAVPVGASVPEGDDPAEVRQEPVLLRSLDGRAADPATPLYNLLLDADHTYFADELLVHNKGL